MRGLVFLLILIFAPVAALAQDAATQDDRGYLQALIEDNLSTEDTQVRIEGFVGSLISTSSIDRLTVADADGVWLTMTGLKLDWSRSALLSRRLEITELSVQSIALDRLPPGGNAPPSAEATPFKLPELPLEIDIRKVAAGEIVLGQSVLGAAATLSLDGSAALADGAGQVTLQADRLDGPTGRFAIAAGYSNETGILDLDVQLEEAQDGIAANLLNLRDRPSVRMTVAGSAPLSRFAARLDLATDGVQRVTGEVTLSSAPNAAPEGQSEKVSRNFSAVLSGDIAPLVAPDLAPFFGDAVNLSVDGSSLADGRVQISRLSAETAALRISGTLDLSANGLPDRFDLSGRIAGASGQPVTLPLPGPATVLTNAGITATFNAATGDTWQATADIRDFGRDGLTVSTTKLDASGTIATAGQRRVSADIGFSATGIGHADLRIARALGEDLTGTVALQWTEGAPLQLAKLQVNGAGLALRAAGELDASETGLTVRGEADLETASIGRFSGLAERDIAGGVVLHAEGSGELLSGSFDLSLRAEATDLVTGTPRLDPLLRGTSQVAVDAKRDETGTELSQLTFTSQAVEIQASGDLSSAAGQLDLRAELTDLSQLEPTLDGAATLDTTLSWQQDAPLRVVRLRLSGVGVDLTASGQVDLADDSLPASGQADLQVAALSRFAELAGRPVSGAVEASVQGSAHLRGGDFELSLKASGEDLGTGLAEADKLLAGTSRVTVRAGRTAGQYSIGEFTVETPVLTAEAQSTAGPGSALAFRARLANVGLFAPDFPGPAEMQGTAEPNGQDWILSLTGSGPGGTTAQVAGLVAGDFGDVDLAFTGSAPLGMANPFIAPQSLQGVIGYDLKLTGRPSLDNLSGRVSTSGARLSAPTLKLVLTDIDAAVDLAGTQAQIGLSARSSEGGGLRVEGPVSLRPGNAAALTGGGRISGTIDVGRTEVQVTTSAPGGGDIIPGLVHVNEPADSRRTRARAGLLAADGNAGSGGATPLGLDVLVRAPSQIFIRGRGLDAEFGGQLRLAGTTADVIPIGQFALIRGRLDLLGKRFDLTEGQVSMQGSLDPYMRLVAETRTETITSRIVIEGQISAPEVQFESDPELPEDEVVAQLLFGRDMSTLSPFQALQLAGAVATLTGRSDGGVVSKLRSGVGLDDLDISSSAEGDTQVRAGKYLTDNLYSDVVVDSAGKTEVNLNFDINSKLKVKGRVDSEGDTGIGIYYQRDY